MTELIVGYVMAFVCSTADPNSGRYDCFIKQTEVSTMLECASVIRSNQALNESGLFYVEAQACLYIRTGKPVWQA